MYPSALKGPTFWKLLHGVVNDLKASRTRRRSLVSVLSMHREHSSDSEDEHIRLPVVRMRADGSIVKILYMPRAAGEQRRSAGLCKMDSLSDSTVRRLAWIERSCALAAREAVLASGHPSVFSSGPVVIQQDSRVEISMQQGYPLARLKSDFVEAAATDEAAARAAVWLVVRMACIVTSALSRGVTFVRDATPNAEAYGAVLASVTVAVAHCDITPANIIIDRDGLPHLIDFGSVRPIAGTLEDVRAVVDLFRGSAGGFSPPFADPHLALMCCCDPPVCAETSMTLDDVPIAPSSSVDFYGLARTIKWLVSGSSVADLTDDACVTAMASQTLSQRPSMHEVQQRCDRELHDAQSFVAARAFWSRLVDKAGSTVFA